MRSIKGILIDFYGTICAGDREAVEAACRQVVKTCHLPVTPDELAVTWGERFFALLERSNHASFQTLHECELRSLRETLAGFGEDADPAPFVAELEDYWRNPPIHADAPAFLRTVELPICCVSNADTQPLREAISKHGLRFDAVVSSQAVRCYKPAPRIFERGLEALGLGPDRVIHVGDSLHSDVGGASRLGIMTVWVRRESRIHDIGKCEPDFTIARLAELRDVIVRSVRND